MTTAGTFDVIAIVVLFVTVSLADPLAGLLFLAMALAAYRKLQ